jgi:hypothetical protein
MYFLGLAGKAGPFDRDKLPRIQLCCTTRHDTYDPGRIAAIDDTPLRIVRVDRDSGWTARDRVPVRVLLSRQSGERIRRGGPAALP